MDSKLETEHQQALQAFQRKREEEWARRRKYAESVLNQIQYNEEKRLQHLKIMQKVIFSCYLFVFTTIACTFSLGYTLYTHQVVVNGFQNTYRVRQKSTLPNFQVRSSGMVTPKINHVD